MAGPRVTGPIAKLARSITTTTQPSTLLTSSKAGAPLSRKYADLLKERNTDPDVSFTIYVILERAPPLPIREAPKYKPALTMHLVNSTRVIYTLDHRTSLIPNPGNCA